MFNLSLQIQIKIITNACLPPPKINPSAVQKHGEVIEKIGKWLQKYCCTIPNYGSEIEEYGLLIQYHAQKSLMYIFLIQRKRLYSNDLFVEALRAYVQAVKVQVEATNLYIKSVQGYINSRDKDQC